MKVLEVISDTNIGGAGMLLLARLRHSDRARFQTTVLLPSGSALAGRFREIGIPVYFMNGCRDQSFDMRHVSELVSTIRRLSPTLINCHGCFSARVAAAIAHVPIRLYTRHCAYPVARYRQMFPCQVTFGAMSNILSHHVIAVADAARENLLDMGIKPTRISVIINGAEALRLLSEDEKQQLRHELKIPDDGVMIGISARLEPCKDHACFLRAAARICKTDERYYFLILGDGSLRPSLEREACRLGIASHTRFLGFVEDVAPYVNLFDLHVNCSIGTETSSLAISEAMSLGIPTVASDYGGNPYMVRDGENGFLYPAGDDVALAGRILRIFESHALYERICKGARERFCAELNAACMTKKTEQLYARLFRERLGCTVTDQADS